MHLKILKCPFLSFISGTHLGLIFKKGFSSSFLSSSSFTVCVDSPICKYPRSGSPPSLPAHQPRQDHGYERTRANVRDITHHFIKKKPKKKACFTFHIYIWWVASSPSLSDEAEEWRFSRLPSTHHFDEISQIQKWLFQNYYNILHLHYCRDHSKKRTFVQNAFGCHKRHPESDVRRHQAA